jgi:hypothetical protein
LSQKSCFLTGAAFLAQGNPGAGSMNGLPAATIPQHHHQQHISLVSRELAACPKA